MASKTIKLKAKAENGEVNVKTLIKHPMETGRRKDKDTGKLVPANYIQEVTCTHKGETVLSAEWGATISKNPFLSFTFTGGAAGEEIELTYRDNKGGTESATAKIS
jgi:sulfur-oxidizing protein SoxZ